MGAGGAEGGGGGGLVAVCGESHCAEAVAGAAGVSGGYDGSGGVLAVDCWMWRGSGCVNEKRRREHRTTQGRTAPARPHRTGTAASTTSPPAAAPPPAPAPAPAASSQTPLAPARPEPRTQAPGPGTAPAPPPASAQHKHRHQAPAPAPAPAQHQQRHRRQRNTGVTGAAWRVCRSTPASPSAPAPAPVHAQQRLPPPAPSPPLAPVQHRQHDRNHPPVVTTQGQGRAKQSQQNKGGKRAPSACQQTQHSGGRWHS